MALSFHGGGFHFTGFLILTNLARSFCLPHQVNISCFLSSSSSCCHNFLGHTSAPSLPSLNFFFSSLAPSSNYNPRFPTFQTPFPGKDKKKTVKRGKNPANILETSMYVSQKSHYSRATDVRLVDIHVSRRITLAPSASCIPLYALSRTQKPAIAKNPKSQEA